MNDRSVRLNVEGMHCGSCVNHVREALRGTSGVREAVVNLATNEANVIVAEGTKVRSLIDAIEKAGYRATEKMAAERPDFQAGSLEARFWRIRFLFGLVATVILAASHYAVFGDTSAHELQHNGVISWLLIVIAGCAQVFVGWPYYLGAWRRLIHLSSNMDTLIAIGTTTAFGVGVWQVLHHESGMMLHDAPMILTFVSLGKWLEQKARSQTSAALQKLVELAPTEALVIDSQGEANARPVAEISEGMTILIRPGERIPLDATIVDGTSSLDEAWLTGESIPVTKKVGDSIFAGSINGPSALRAKVVHRSGETGLDKVVELVRRAQESRANVQRLADYVVSWFVPAILMLALATFLIWGALSRWSEGLGFTVAVLVVACPCALGLATPTAILVASGRGAEAGILLKNAHAIERSEQISTVVFDKTGTVTEGKLQIDDVVTFGTTPRIDVLRYAASLETQSTHPLAKAIVEQAKSEKLNIPLAMNVKQVAGEGVSGSVELRNVAIGNERFMEHKQVPIEASIAEQLQARQSRGHAVVMIAIGNRVAGLISLADRIRPSSREGIAQLVDMGLKVRMLSGDNEVTTRHVAEAVGVADYRSGLRPEDKYSIIDELRRGGERVAMVGDGINDAAALAAADLGIAIGAGADVAIDAADIVLMKVDVKDVALAIRLARSTLRTIRQNLVWAFVYNLALLPLAAGCFVPINGWRLPPVFAAAAMALSSVSVVSNSLLLKRIGRR